MFVAGGSALPVAVTNNDLARPVQGGPAQPVYVTNPTAAGTAFPTSPAAGDVFFRTDLGWWCYWDGTRWLTAHELVYATATVIDTNNGNTNAVPARGDYAPYITRVALTRLVLTTNNGSNFWTIVVRGVNGSVGATTTLRTQSTAADAANAYTVNDAAPATATPANRAGFDIAYTKSGTPGSLIAQATIHTRLIIP
jgi:hypothetical protein